MSQKFVKEYLESVATKAGISTTSEGLLSRELAEKLNECDELAHLRNEFCIPKMGTLPEGEKLQQVLKIRGSTFQRTPP